MPAPLCRQKTNSLSRRPGSDLLCFYECDRGSSLSRLVRYGAADNSAPNDRYVYRRLHFKKPPGTMVRSVMVLEKHGLALERSLA